MDFPAVSQAQDRLGGSLSASSEHLENGGTVAAAQFLFANLLYCGGL
jgi:hypothetical protein